ncbi:MAG: ABC transporter ATP-binding protein [Planctomycetota bacterium]
MASSAARHIEIRGLSKRYGQRDALAKIDLDVAHGECHGILGHNGSGKTTLLRVIATLLRPSAGEVRIDELCLPRDAVEVRHRIGLMLDRPFLPLDLSLQDGLRYYASVQRRRCDSSTVDAALERVGLAWRRRDPLRCFSRGMLQRASLACLWLKDPAILALDEPFTGLDLAGCRWLEEWLAERRRAGRTVLLVTHETERAERLCDRITVLRGGRVVQTAVVGQLDATLLAGRL